MFYSVKRYAMVDSLFCSVVANSFREIGVIRGLLFALISGYPNPRKSVQSITIRVLLKKSPESYLSDSGL